jgi:hypothetical protein
MAHTEQAANDFLAQQAALRYKIIQALAAKPVARRPVTKPTLFQRIFGK